MAATVGAVRAELADLVGRPAVAADFGDSIAAAVHRVLPYDGWCLLGMDPKTGLRTFPFGRHGTEHTVEMAADLTLPAACRALPPRPRACGLWSRALERPA